MVYLTALSVGELMKNGLESIWKKESRASLRYRTIPALPVGTEENHEEPQLQ
jgi:hypothetical protein